MKKGIFGWLLLIEGFFATITVLVSLLYKDDDVPYLSGMALFCILVGSALKYVGGKSRASRLTRSDSFLIVSLTWVIFSLIGMVPWILYPGTHMDAASAFFETMSGFSTTGGTVLDDIDSLPHGLLFWRSMTQWMGGLGIVVFTLALIPAVELHNSNIFSAEVTGIGLDKLRPKLGATCRRLLVIYLFLTGLCATLYWIGPMDLFDAVNHSMTTIATGGFSTHQSSIAYFHSSYIEWVASFFMIVSSINFSIYYYLTIRRPQVLLRNDEMKFFLQLCLVMVSIFIFLFLYAPIDTTAKELVPSSSHDIVRSSVFHVATVISSTGFQGQYFDYVGWGAPFWMPTVLIMGIGACAGSTAGGMKCIRILICGKTMLNVFRKQLHPRAVTSISVNGQIIDNDRVQRALSFLFLYCLLVVFGMTFFTFVGSDVDTGLGCCVSSLSNIGPGTGTVGPAFSYSHVPASAKWLLSFYMLVGRLEIYTVLLLFMPSFWRQNSEKRF